MFRVEVRYAGEYIWRTMALPGSLQSAAGQASVLSHSRIADQARVVAAGESTRIAGRKV